MTAGERIRQARRAADMTQRALAAALAVDQSTVARWEKGASAPGPDCIARIAQITMTSPEWLAFGRCGTRTTRDNERAEGATDAIPTGFDTSALPARSIAFQGLPGAYSHLACRAAFPELDPMPYESFEAAFAAVSDGVAGLAMIPIENSLGGRVADIHHLLPSSSLYIVAEHFQPVHHVLLAVPGTRLERLKSVRSHPQALAQCRTLIRDLRLEAVPHSDTAGAAREVMVLGDAAVGAIASELASEIYGLDIVRRRVEDRIGNTTRFVVMARQRLEPDPAGNPCMTSLVFQVRSVPAALYKALGGFATAGVNITKLESYITDASFAVAQFYAEIEGHPAHKAVDMALDELQYFSTKMKVLGVYRSAPFRQHG